jgi:hypothetical protein
VKRVLAAKQCLELHLAARLDAPHDPSDFGRCYRLVQIAPSIREDFDRIGKMVPQFAGILREWDALCAIYERDLSSGKSDELYKKIMQLRAITAAPGITGESK